MSMLLGALVGTLIGLAVLVVARLLLEWRPRRRPRKLPKLHVLSFDWCCICLIDLYEGEVWEKREHLALTGEEVGGGGSWVARTYCEEHAPADAMPPLQSRR